MPVCSVASTARLRISSSLTSLAASSSFAAFNAALTVMRREVFLPLFIVENMLFNWLVISSRPGGAIISTLPGDSLSFISISLSSISPCRSFFLKTCLAAELESVWLGSPASAACSVRACGSSTSRMRSSALSSARCCTLFISVSLSILIATSTRSRIIDSTSLPT